VYLTLRNRKITERRISQNATQMQIKGVDRCCIYCKRKMFRNEAVVDKLQKLCEKGSKKLYGLA
jgi:hypothetical protein